MDKKFITAQEANENAKAYSDMENICEQIERAAEKGRFQTFFWGYYPKRQGES